MADVDTDRPRRGRRPGPIPRADCSVCGQEHALRANGTVGQHQRRTPQGYRIGTCPGVGKPPKASKAEQVSGGET